MTKEELRDELMHQLKRMNKLDVILHLREFVEGESAVLGHLYSLPEQQHVIPSQISESLHISRARTANILRTLRKKGFIEMEIAEEDRRKMYVSLTQKGFAYLDKKFLFLKHYFDLYVEVLGEQDILELTRLLKKTVDSEHLIPLDF